VELKFVSRISDMFTAPHRKRDVPGSKIKFLTKYRHLHVFKSNRFSVTSQYDGKCVHKYGSRIKLTNHSIAHKKQMLDLTSFKGAEIVIIPIKKKLCRVYT